ncbi:MAG TPA: DNA polymerase III subunit delta' [Pirellulales bacterium]|nr:DNA polymerase III subunit delta' [Pirellulales bacterium]
MAWQGLEGHDDVVERFRASLARGRLAHTFLFVGPAGIGKRSFALRLAAALLCQRRPAAALDPCGQCPSCLQIAAGTHPDLLMVSKPADKSFIPLELFIGPKEKRMQQGLCHDISLKPFMGGRRVAIIDDADYLNEEGANSLLKTLEEPPAQSVLILIGTSADRQLPTIRSRAQTVRFRPLPAEVVAQQLVARGLVEDRATAERLAGYSGGSITHAAELADPALWKFRDVLFAQLGERSFDSVTFAKTLAAFVDEAGKEAPLRRARMRLVIGFAIEFHRELVRALAGVPAAEASPHEEVTRAAASGRFDRVDLAALAERSIEALGHVDRNAHQAALLECWLDDLVQLSQPPRVPV